MRMLRRIGATLDAARQNAVARAKLAAARAEYDRVRRELCVRYPVPSLDHVVSQIATAEQIDSPRFDEVRATLRLPPLRHRKWWEFVWIAEALGQAGMLREGKRGLGFGVGKEPLASHFAREGCAVVATDAPLEQDKGWSQGNQHAAGLAALNERGICDEALFAARVTFRPVDMNRIPDDLVGFDFCWSACAFEHLGSIDAGLAFVERSLACLVPGGVAVHTTELNLSSNDRTIERGETVAFRRRDLEAFAARLRDRGHTVAELNFHPGDRELDRYVDLPPYQQDPHVKLLLDRYVCTSVGLLVRNGP